MRRIIKIIIIVLLCASVYYKYFFYYDHENGCAIKITPSFEMSNTTIKNAIEVLKYGSPEEYKNLCTNIDTISTDVSCGGFGGGCYEHTPRRITISTSGRKLLITAAIITHETCHAVQDKENRTMDENECYKASDRALDTLAEF
jgi:hypothetical protein